MSFETEVRTSSYMTPEQKKILIRLANAQAELIETREWAREHRSFGFPEEMLQEAIVKAQKKFEVARADYLGIEV